MTLPEFVPPGPGVWELDRTHTNGAMTRFAGEVIEAGFAKGFAEGTKHYGLLLDSVFPRLVNGFMFAQIRPVGAPPDAKGPPPKLLFKVLLRLHPELRRRTKRARQVIDERAWLADMRHWDEEFKPRMIRDLSAFQANDPTSIDNDAAMAEHVQQCFEIAVRGVFGHHRFTATAILPVGDFLARASDWSGEAVHDLLPLLSGASPISAGLAAAELDKLVEAMREKNAATLLDNGKPEEALEALRESDPSVGEALGAYMEMIGQRIVTGYDIADLRAVEFPELVVKTIRASYEETHEGKREKAEAELAERTAAVRDKVPQASRDAFDTLLSDARAVYRLRDERGIYNDAWATGLARRGMLAAGQRLAEAGRIERPELLVEASLAEALSLLRGDGGPSSDELAERHQYRATTRIEDVPDYLGGEPGAPPPTEWLPPHSARLESAVGAFIMAMHDSPAKAAAQADEQTRIAGIAASPGVYEGRARIVLGASDFHRIEKGDVLVARVTSAYFNPLLPLLGGIVTDRGGALSHAAIVAREYGIPGVVSTKVATQQIPDGARIRVDGTAGEVTVLSS